MGMDTMSEALSIPKHFIIAILQSSPYELRNLPWSVRADETIVRGAIECNPLALRYAADIIRSDREIVKEAVLRKASALKHATSELLRDRQFLLDMVFLAPDCLPHASVELKESVEFVYEATMRQPRVLQWVKARFRDNRKLCRAAVAQLGYMLEFAGPRCRRDRDIVLLAVKKHGFALQWACSTLVSDREIVHAAVKSCGASIAYAASSLMNEPEILLAAIRNDPCALKCLSFERLERKLEDTAVDIIRRTDLPLECAKLRLTLAKLAVGMGNFSFSTDFKSTIYASRLEVPLDLAELTATFITGEALASVIISRTQEPSVGKAYKILRKVWKKVKWARNSIAVEFPYVWKHYQETIAKPMDLGQVRRNLDAGKYRPEPAKTVPPGFQRDMRLIFENAVQYNNPDHRNGRGAEYHDLSEKWLSRLDKWLKPPSLDERDVIAKTVSAAYTPASILANKRPAPEHDGDPPPKRVADSEKGSGERSKVTLPVRGASPPDEPPPIDGAGQRFWHEAKNIGGLTGTEDDEAVKQAKTSR